jgi:hypothetical protein
MQLRHLLARDSVKQRLLIAVCVRLAVRLRLAVFSTFPSTASQSTSSMAGGTTRTNVARFTASKPLPPRDTVSYLPRRKSIVLPPDVSITSASCRLEISAPPRQTSPLPA